MHSARFPSVLVACAAVVLWLLFPGSLPAQCALQWLPGGGLLGLDGSVLSVTAWDPDGAGPAPARVVAGGNFRIAGSALAESVAVWDPSTGMWSALGTGLNDNVTALAVLPNGDLVAGGL